MTDEPAEGDNAMFDAMSELEMLVSESYDEGVVTEVIRPAAILPEEPARAVLVELALRDVQHGGDWLVRPRRAGAVRPAVGRPRRARRAPARGQHPGRLRDADPLRDHDLPRDDHRARHRARLDRQGALRRGARLRQRSRLATCPRATPAPPPNRSSCPGRAPRDLDRGCLRWLARVLWLAATLTHARAVGA